MIMAISICIGKIQGLATPFLKQRPAAVSYAGRPVVTRGMHERFSGYSHLYSGPYFEPQQSAPQSAGFVQRLAFYVGLLGMFTALPLTLLLVLYLMRKAPR